MSVHALFSSWSTDLHDLRQFIDNESPVPTSNLINVIRGSEFGCFERAFRRKNFDVWKRINVQFVDFDSTKEGATDNGGPSREFFRLLLSDVLSSHLFEGPTEAKQLSLSTTGCHPIDTRILFFDFCSYFST